MALRSPAPFGCAAWRAGPGRAAERCGRPQRHQIDAVGIARPHVMALAPDVEGPADHAAAGDGPLDLHGHGGAGRSPPLLVLPPPLPPPPPPPYGPRPP